MKVLSVVGARPQFVKLAPIARAAAEHNVDHVVVHTGQHYDEKMSASWRDLRLRILAARHTATDPPPNPLFERSYQSPTLNQTGRHA